MLNFLLIRNFALIQHLELEPASGFTVLTGETGAGKSIILSALNLILGAKAAADLIRQGEEQASVEALFSLDQNTAELLLKRVVNREGRNRVQIDGNLGTLSALTELSIPMVSLCGQHEQQSLLKPEEHLAMLDAFAGLQGEKEQMLEAFRAIMDIERQIRKTQEDLSRGQERGQWLRQVINELEEARLDVEEEEALRAEYQLLRNAGQRSELSQGAYVALYAAEKGAALSSLNKALGLARELAGLDERMQEVASALEESYFTLEDLAYSLRDYASKVGAEPGRLDQIEERISHLQRIARRHGGSVESALQALALARAETATLENGEEELLQLNNQKLKAIEHALQVALALSQARQKAAPLLAGQVENELKELGMSACQFEARFFKPGGQTIETSAGPLSGRGLEAVEFYLAPNPGEGFRPLIRTASGGELSRLLLALRGISARQMGSPTLIFDEVDAGIGGDVGLAVGGKLARLAQNAQVICITHLPQIAAFADRHFQVVKQVIDGRTTSQLNLLDDADREDELARMLGAGPSARSHARELLRMAK